MRRILVTGMSGTGKSSVLAALARHGYRAVDTGDAGWTVEDSEGGRFRDEESGWRDSGKPLRSGS